MIATLKRAARLARFFYYQRVSGLRVPDEPHFDTASTEWFMQRLRRSKSYLEFGSGGSTLVAARQGIPTVSVESDRFFARAVLGQVADTARLRMLPVDIGLTGEWGTPVFRKPTAARHLKWRRYVEEPFEVIGRDGSGFPDLVLVDGRFRRACALQAARKGSAAGTPVTLCVDDYGDRPDLAAIEPFLGRPEMHGRMAVFEIAPDTIAMPDEAVEEAIRDYR